MLHAVFQLLVKHHARAVQLLIIDTHRHDKMAENVFGNHFTPRHFLGRTLRGMDIVQIELAREVGNVRQRHVGVEKLQRLAFVSGQLRVEHGKEVALR